MTCTIRECECGQPWRPAAGLYGTTEETRCQACVLREMLQRERAECDVLRRLLERVCPAPHLTLDADWLSEAKRAGCKL
jgi:hypothetical protein